MKKIHLLPALLLFFLAFSWVSFADEDQASEAPSSKTDFSPLSKDQVDLSTLQRRPQSSSPLHTLESYQSVTANVPVSQNPLSAVNPEKYVLAPGDSLVLDVWTPEYRRVSGSISPSNTINIAPIGDVSVSKITLSRLSAHLEEILKKYYKDAHVTADLTSVRTLKIQVLGEVKQPGAYELSGIAGALDAVVKAGGLTERSSVRQIELRKEDKLIRRLDYFRWRTFGDESQNPYLEPNEVVYVPIVKNRVSIDGEIRRPGNYEFVSGETFQDLVKMAGGYTPEAVVGELKISRISAPRSEINLSASDQLALQDGDSVYVPPLSLFQQKIKVMGEIQGAVTSSVAAARTGELTRMVWYHLHEQERVRDVVLNLGGLTPKADGSMARIERKDRKGQTTVIPVNLQKLFAEGDTSQNVLLKDGDSLIVPAAADSVYVLGEVSRPGVFPYIPNNRIREYVALAGGPASHANVKHVKLVRLTEDPNKPNVTTVNLNGLLQGGEKNLLLEPGDVIYVPRSEITGFSDLINLLGSYGIVRALFLR